MSILLKLDNAKFNVSNLFCSEVIEGKSLGCRLDLLGNKRVTLLLILLNETG